MPAVKKAIAILPTILSSVFSAIIVCSIVTVVLVAFFRIFQGPSFLDESYYVAVPYRFFLGDKPYVDQFDLVQSFGLLTMPLVALHHWVIGNSDGLVLSFRYCLLCLQLLTSLLVYLTLRKRLGWRLSATLALIFTGYSNLEYTLSYGVLGSGLTTLAFFLALLSYWERPKPSMLLWVGALMGTALIAHPMSLFALLLLAALIGLFYPGSKSKNLICFSLGVLAVCLSVAFYYSVSPRKVIATLSYSANLVSESYQQSIMSRCGWLIGELGKSSPFHWKSLLGYALLVWVFYRKFNVAFMLIVTAFVPYIYLTTIRPSVGGIGLLGLPTYFSLLAPLLAPLVWKEKLTRILMTALWLPAFLAGMFLSFFSNSGTFRYTQMSLPACIVSLALVALIVKDRLGTLRHFSGIGVIPALCFLLIATYVGPFSRLFDPNQTRFSSGPFKGLSSGRAEVEYLEGLTNDVRRYERKDGRIFFYCFFPAGYLLTSMRPAVPSPWSCYEFGEKQCASYHSRFFDEMTVAVKVTKKSFLIDGLWQEPCPEFENAVSSALKKTVRGKNSIIYLKDSQ